MPKSVKVTLTAAEMEKMVAMAEQSRERAAKLGLERSGMTKSEREEFLAIRKEAGAKIDPETAEVDWTYGSVLDPYGIFPPFEEDNVGRNYFARSPGSDVWVEFRDIPEETRDVLWKKHSRRIAFPARLEAVLTASNRTRDR
jgi:hypothetical protein